MPLESACCDWADVFPKVTIEYMGAHFANQSPDQYYDMQLCAPPSTTSVKSSHQQTFCDTENRYFYRSHSDSKIHLLARDVDLLLTAHTIEDECCPLNFLKMQTRSEPECSRFPVAK